ncbi:MAG: hypothetical protein IPM57_05480 [Oligoflexia bacterium]|nr:hypothetical protein [Oligoflexia bacterium]
MKLQGFKFYRLLMSSTLLASLAACVYGDSGSSGGTNVDIKPPIDNSKVVCTPFSGGDPALPYNGAVANLVYLSDDQPRYTNVIDYINNGHLADVTLFLNKLDTPTRPFDFGFVTEAGSLIQDQTGDTLYEYFGLHVESFLKLREGDPVGDYQFALLSDDGAVMQIDDLGLGFRTLVDNNGTHPTRMACSSERIPFDQNTMLPMKLDYYQGPRYHIALTLLWRPYPENPADVNDPLCGRQGNSLFWDSTQTPSAPNAFNDLLARGWRVVSTENFRLPASFGSNPCAQVTDVTISNFQIVSVGRDSAVIQWETNVPTDSKVVYSAYPYSVNQEAYDSAPTTMHVMNLTGLTPFTLYSLYVVSVEPGSGSQASNDATTFRTLR